MSKQLIDFLHARLAAQDQLLLAIGQAVKGLAKGPQAQALGAALEAATNEFASHQLPPSTGWTDERRQKLGAAVSQAWQAKKDDLKLFFFEWANQPPTRVTYEEAAQLLGYASSTLRMRISKAPSKSLAIYKGGRYYVLAKTEDGLEPALNARFVETGDPDQVARLPHKPKAR